MDFSLPLALARYRDLCRVPSHKLEAAVMVADLPSTMQLYRGGLSQGTLWYVGRGFITCNILDHLRVGEMVAELAGELRAKSASLPDGEGYRLEWGTALLTIHTDDEKAHKELRHLAFTGVGQLLVNELASLTPAKCKVKVVQGYLELVVPLDKEGFSILITKLLPAAVKVSDVIPSRESRPHRIGFTYQGARVLAVRDSSVRE